MAGERVGVHRCPDGLRVRCATGADQVSRVLQRLAAVHLQLEKGDEAKSELQRALALLGTADGPMVARAEVFETWVTRRTSTGTTCMPRSTTPAPLKRPATNPARRASCSRPLYAVARPLGRGSGVLTMHSTMRRGH